MCLLCNLLFSVSFVLMFLIRLAWQVNKKNETKRRTDRRRKGKEICSCAHGNNNTNDSLEIIFNKAEVGWEDLWSLLAPLSF